jgi:hypothetical protein
MQADESRRNRLAVLVLVLWVPYMTSLTVLLGTTVDWPLWSRFGAVAGATAVFALVLAGSARLVVGPGWTALLRRRRTGWNGVDVVNAVATWLTIMIVVIGSRSAQGDLSALVLVGLSASAPVVVTGSLVRWWWLPRAADRADR